MKKAKLLLIVLLISFGIGIIIAFKARSSDRLYIDTDGDCTCDTFITGHKLTNSGDPDAYATVACTTLNGKCFDTFALNTGN